MSDSTRYFQLTPDILMEYNYNNITSAYEQSGNAEHIVDLGDDEAYIINNGFCSTRTFMWEKQKNHFVLPINKSESKFIQCVNDESSIWDRSSDFGCEPFLRQLSVQYDYDNDILRDTFRLHFTSRNYFGDYDGYILTINIYDNVKNKIGLMSYYIRRTDDPTIDANPILINQKLYTTYQDFSVVNIAAILKADTLINILPGEKKLNKMLSPKYGIMENTPVMMSIYGVKSTYENNGFEYYNTEKLNTIYIPIEDKFQEINVEIKEATDGDYFKIYPVVNNKTVSFSDYINTISDGRPEIYIVFYELTTEEFYVNSNSNIINTDITHREQYIINAAQQISDNGNTVLEINERELDGIMYYRPVIIHGSNIVKFTINVKLYIVNTYDNTTIVKRASLSYPDNLEDKGSAQKYGKRMNRIYLGEVPTKVNVYNKKPDIDVDGLKLTNASSNVKIENHQHSVIGFIECSNVGVSIEQIPTELLS
jgi:hypothetical protein